MINCFHHEIASVAEALNFESSNPVCKFPEARNIFQGNAFQQFATMSFLQGSLDYLVATGSSVFLISGTVVRLTKYGVNATNTLGAIMFEVM